MPAPRPSTIVFAVDGPVARAELPTFCGRLRDLLERSGAAVAVCDVGALGSDVEAVDALARLQLTARRLGREVRLRRAPRELRELLDLMGFADVLRLEAIGQAEEREDRLGAEEEGELGDPPA